MSLLARKTGDDYRQILRTWWPLAASWLLMSVELPALSAVIARLANPEINLAAYGGIIFPIALIVESPIIMLLAASTALSRDRQSYEKLRRFMLAAGATLTGIHILIAFTPLYYVLVQQIIRVPAEIVEPARIGLMLMTPWSWSIAYRRFNQGVMIRYGYSQGVGVGTVVRLTTGGIVLVIGFLVKTIPGVAVGAAAQAVGVMSEAFYAGWRVRPILREHMIIDLQDEPLTWRAFASFYIPLALNSLLFLLWQPVGSAALSRMPDALASLAVWPVLSSLVFILRSFGMAYNEVVVALLDRHGFSHSLRRFAFWLSASVFLIHLTIAVSPLSSFYFNTISALPPRLAEMAVAGFWISLPISFLGVYQSWFQGAILYGKRTRGIPESVVVFFVTVLAVLLAGVGLGQFTGLYVSMTGFVLANFAQAAWLWVRSRPVMRQVTARDADYSGERPHDLEGSR